MRKFALSFVLTCVLFETVTFAFIKPQRNRTKSSHHHNHAIQQKIVRPLTYEASTKLELYGSKQLSSVKRDKLTGTVRLLTGDFGYVQEVGTKLEHYRDHALGFVDSNFDIFGVKVDDLKLIPKATLLSDDVQFIQFALFKEGLLVEDASLSFRFKQKKLVQITNFGFTEAARGEIVPLSEDKIENKIIKATGAKSLTKQYESYRIEEKGKGYALRKIAGYSLIDRDGISLNLQADEVTGEIYELKEDKFYFGGDVSAELYPRWYEDDIAETPMPFVKVKNDLSENTVLSDLLGHFEVPDTTNRLYLDKLKGQFVKINNLSGPDIAAEGNKSQDNYWSVKLPSPQTDNHLLDKTTAQYMVYYHVTKAIGHVSKYIHPAWIDEPLVANTNLTQHCNAHWDGSTINLYSGSGPSRGDRCANTGLISDIIYHEWGHGLDANTGGIQDSAFSEGIGDIISLLITRSPLLGVGFWAANGGPVRNLEPNKIYPRDQGEVHDEGLIIGSTFWDLYEALSKKYDSDKAIDLLSQYILKGIYTARTYLDLYDAMLVIDDEDHNIETPSANTCLINKIFTNHGLAQNLDWCALAKVEDFNLVDENGNGIFEPGEKVEISVTATNPGAEPLNNLMGTLTEDGNLITILEPTLEWNKIASGERALSNNTASFTINEEITCGSQVDLHLRLAADTREAFTNKIFTVGYNEGTEEVGMASDLPKDIYDYSVTTSSLEIAHEEWQSGVKIHDAQLAFTVRHSYVGDLIIKLVAPNGEKILLFRGQGAGSEIVFNESITDKIAHLDSAAGTWSLEIADNAFQDSGTLESFSLSLTPSLFRCD